MVDKPITHFRLQPVKAQGGKRVFAGDIIVCYKKSFCHKAK